MKNAENTESTLAPVLNELGLFSFGWFIMDEAPFAGRKALLIGNRAQDGVHRMWEVFSASMEFADGEKHALDRWTERVVGVIAKEHEATALYPFGEKLWPFQRYAKAATGMQSSPLGMLIHPEFGLWQAFRAVLVFGSDLALNIPQKLIHICDECLEKPCLSACPVNAFSADGFAVEACRGHLKSSVEPDCMKLGCRARAACPVGVSYSDEQIRFHMAAFGR